MTRESHSSRCAQQESFVDTIVMPCCRPCTSRHPQREQGRRSIRILLRLWTSLWTLCSSTTPAPSPASPQVWNAYVWHIAFLQTVLISHRLHSGLVKTPTLLVPYSLPPEQDCASSEQSCSLQAFHFCDTQSRPSRAFRLFRDIPGVRLVEDLTSRQFSGCRFRGQKPEGESATHR